MDLSLVRKSLNDVTTNIKSFNKRILYFDRLFPKIGSGSGRVVYDLNDQYVLKIAKNPKGIAQNEVEVELSNYNDLRDIVTLTYDSDDDFTWMIAEKAKKVTPSRFKQLTGYDINSIYYALYNQFNKQSYSVPDEIYENEFYKELAELVANYNTSIGDFNRISSFGEVIRYGQPTIVATDYGLNDEVYRTYYDKVKRIYELYNNSDGNDDILSDIGGGEDIRNGLAGGTAIPDSVDEREIKYMKGGSSVSVKDQCKLGGGKTCNQGDINNLNIKNISEDIDPKEAVDIESTMNTLIENKRDVGFVPRLNREQMSVLNKNDVGILPIKSKFGMAYILYRNKEKALILRDFAASKGGVLNDETPEEARIVGRLLSYKENTIDEYIRRKYKIKPIPVDTRTPEDFNDLDEEIENEGVGDKYAEKRFGIKPEFDTFDKQFNQYQNNKKEEIIYRGEFTLIKNPKSLENIGAYVRGIIDRYGNLYVEEESKVIHDPILWELSDLGLVRYDDEWTKSIPSDYVCLIRYGSTNTFYLSESYLSMTPEEERDYEYDDDEINWYDIPNFNLVKPKVQEFLNKAKIKNPKIDFVNSVERFLNEIEINETEIMNEAEIMSLQDLPFKEEVRQLGGDIYSVGGAVRDEFLGKESKDLDILITGIPMEQLEQILTKYGRVDAVGKSFGILKFKPKGSTEDIDVAIPRTEKPTGEGGHKGFEVSSDHNLSIEDDLFRRDLTINAIAKSIDGKIIDPYNGLEDLRNKIIRIVNPQAFSDDPLRMLRAIQFSTRFGFDIEPNTMEMIKKNAGRISEIPNERVIGEFDKIIHKGNPYIGARLLIDTGIYEHLFGVKPNESIIDSRPFAQVKTMGEFIFLLTFGIVNNPSEFFKSKMKGDLDAYKQMKAFELAFSTSSNDMAVLRSIAHNMYVLSPYSITSEIISGVLKKACDELNSGKYPKIINELAINGNDLMGFGLKGKEIGDAQKKILMNIYSDKLKNVKEDIISFLFPNNNVLNESEKKDKVDYGCLMLFLDVPVWSKITSIIKKEDLHEKGLEDESHVTVLYGFHDEVSSDEVFALYKENYSLKPLEIKISGISIFENPEFDVVKFDVNSDELAEINKLMRTLPNTQTFPDYHPHITIAYVKKGSGSKYVKKFKDDRILIGNELIYTWKGHRGKEGGESLILNDNLNESTEISKYSNTKESLIRSKSISKEMKEKISQYLTGGSTYHEGGRVHGLSKPNGFREKTPKSNGVSLGADKNGFYCYTHRAASKRYESPEKIPVKDIEFIESTG